MASPFVNNLTQNGRLSIRRAEPDGGRSHDGLDVAKIGGSMIRRWGKAGVLGRGEQGGKKGEGGRRHGAAGGWSGRRVGQGGRQEERRRKRSKAWNNCSKTNYLPKFKCILDI